MKQVLPSYKTYFQAIILWLGLLWLGGLSAQISIVEDEGNKVNQCFAPTFTLAEPTPTGNVRISWQGNPKHNKYHVQYRKQGAVGSSSGGSGQSAVGGQAVGSEQFEWFEVYTYGDQVQVSNLQPGVTYEFRVGGTCHELTDFNQGYTYTSINTFTMPTADESVSYSCGIVPEINITNTTPLENLGVNETFTAGDFPVTIKQIQGGNGVFSGTGFIVVPYLADTKIAVEFSGITINTDYQLIDGVIQTTYDADWGGVEDVGDDSITDDENDDDEATGDDGNSGDSTTDDDTAGDGNDNADDTSGEDTDEGENNEDGADSNDGEENNENVDDDNVGNGNGSSNNGNNPGGINNNGENNNTTETPYITYNDVKYYDGDTVDINYNSNENNIAFFLNNYPESTETFKWTFYHNDSDSTQEVKNNEDNLDNFGMDISGRAGDIRLKVNYNEESIEIDFNIIKEKFEFIELYAKHSNNRIAKSDQTLYLIDPLGTTNAKKSIRFDIAMKPNLSDDLFSEQDIVWYYDASNQQTNLGKDFGKKFLQKNVSETINPAEYKVEAGYPNKIEKGLTIEWIDEYRESISFLPPGINEALSNVEKGLGLINTYLPSSIETKFDVSVTGEEFNREDNASRLLIERQEGSLTGGLEFYYEFMIPSLSIDLWSIGKIGAYIKPSANVGVNYILRREKFNTENAYQIKAHSFGFTGGFCAQLGAKAELFPGVQIDGFEATLEVYGESCVQLEAKLELRVNEPDVLSYESYWNPLVGGVNGSVEVGGYELLNITKTWYLFSRLNGPEGEIRIND